MAAGFLKFTSGSDSCVIFHQYDDGKSVSLGMPWKLPSILNRLEFSCSPLEYFGVADCIFTGTYLRDFTTLSLALRLERKVALLSFFLEINHGGPCCSC